MRRLKIRRRRKIQGLVTKGRTTRWQNNREILMRGGPKPLYAPYYAGREKDIKKKETAQLCEGMQK
jgi:predicted transcriptional regulator